VEEEWEEEDDMSFVPDQDLASEDHVYFDIDDQKPDDPVVYDAIPIPVSFYHGEASNNVETNYSDSRNCVHSNGYIAEFSEEDQKPIIGDGALFQDEENGCGVKEESTANLQSSDDIFETGFTVESNYFGGEAFLDPSYLVQNDGLYLETNDLSNTQQDGFDFEDYLTFFDEGDEDAQNLTFDPSLFMGTEDVITDQEELFLKAETEELEKEETYGGKQVVEDKEKDEASCSTKQVDANATESEPDNKYPFLKKASHMLGAIPALPAFAFEFPTKDAAIRFHEAQPSGPVYVTAGVITISDGNMGWSYGKNQNLDLILSFGLVQGNEKPTESSLLTRTMLMFMCLWVLLLSVSFKVSTLVSSR
jgi:hypothetical protein